MTSLKLIVYGKSSFNQEDFTPIKNDNWCKPRGGLWTSLINSKLGWKQWCLSEDFEIDKLSTHFLISYTGNTLKIDSLEDAKKMIWEQHKQSYFTIIPDFEQMQKEGIDAIWLTPQGESETRFNSEYSLYGWDCESVLVMNPDYISIPNIELTRNLDF